MKRILWTYMLLFLSIAVQAQTQQGYVKTKGRMVNGQHVRGQGLTGAVVELYGRTAVGVQNADGSFSFPVVGKSFTVQSVTKKGYQLVDADAAPKAYAYSGNPLYLVMETPEQQQADQVAAERKLRRTLQQQLQKREDEIDAMNATIEEKNRLLAELYESQQNNEKLIADMAKEYAQMDYDQMDSLNQRISDAILNGRLIEADSLLRSKGDMRDRIAVIRREQQAEAQREEEIANEQRELAATKAGTRKKLEDAASDCYKFFDRFKLENQHDSAAYYIELRAELDTANAKWQFDAANYLYKQNQFQRAAPYYEKALEIYRLAAANPQAYEPDVAHTLNNLAYLYYRTQRFEESEAMFKEALEILRSLAASNPQVYEPDVATTQNNLANLYKSTQRFEESEAMFKESLEIRRRLAAANPQTYEPDVATTLRNQALLYSDTQRFEESEAMYREALEIHRRLAAANPQAYEPDVAMTLNNLAILYYSTQRLGESEAMYREALEIRRRLAAANPQAYEPDVAQTLNNLALLYKGTQHLGESEAMHREALEICRRLAAANPQAYEPDAATTLNNLANLYSATQRFGESEAMYREALEIRRRLAASNPQAYEPDVAQTLTGLAILYYSTQRFGESEAMYREALEIYKRLYDNQPDLYRGRVAWIQYFLMYIYGQDNTHIELYDQMLNDALANWEVLYAGNDNYKDIIVELRKRKGWRWLANNETDEALKLFESAYQLNPEKSAGYLASGYKAKAYEYARVKDFSKAIETIDKAITLMPNEANYYDSKGEILLMKGDEAGAVEMWKKVMALDPDFLSTHNSDLYKQLKERGLIE